MEKTKYVEHYFNSYMHYLYFFYYELNTNTKKTNEQIEKELENVDHDLIIMAISFNILHFHKHKIQNRLKSEAYEHAIIIFKKYNKGDSFNFEKKEILTNIKTFFFNQKVYILSQNEKDKFYRILKNKTNYMEEIAEIKF